MKLYAVTFDCPLCGKTHQVIGGVVGGLLIPHGPDHAGTVAELWPDGDYPLAVAEVIRGKVWCDPSGEYVEMGSPSRLTVTPRAFG